MHDVGAAEFAKQQRQVRQLGRNRAEYLILTSGANGAGGTGLIGTSQASTSGSPSHARTSRAAWTA